MHPDSIQQWLMLLRTPGIGSLSARQLLTKIELADLFKASTTTLATLGLRQISINALQNPQWQLIEPDLAWLEHPNHHFITYRHPDFPPLLTEISDSPLALYVAGDSKLLYQPQLAIVGSRNPTPTGIDVAHDFAKHLAKIGLVITSGLALGIDTQAHQGALAANGATIAVLGTGIDIVYPHRNRALATNIVEQGGAIVSEFPLGTAAKPENFPIRNRLVSGLSIGTLVVEATIRSGSLITARLAAEQGREVFAIPGSIHNPLARGCHQLLRQGAKLVETAQDILEELSQLIDSNDKTEQTTTTGETTTVVGALDPEYQKLLEYVDFAATPVDLLVEKTGFSASNVASMLLILELEGFVAVVPGGYAKLKRQ